MADLALTWDVLSGQADLARTDDGTDLLADNGLQTAVLLSVGLDRRARPDDKIPDGTNNPRGWWADQFFPDQIGSRRWILDREKRTPEAAKRLQDCDQEALAWLVEDKVAEKVVVTVEPRTPEQWGAAGLPFREHGFLETVTIVRHKDAIRGRHSKAWQVQLALDGNGQVSGVVG